MDPVFAALSLGFGPNLPTNLQLVLSIIYNLVQINEVSRGRRAVSGEPSHHKTMYLKEEVLSARSALRMRLKSEVSSAHTFVNGNEVTGQGSLEAVTQLEQLFERTVQVGENQSGLLLGSDSSRRRFIVTHAMRNLRGKFGDFTVVYLNGVILQNELEAFKEFTAQLTRATAVKHPVGSKQ